MSTTQPTTRHSQYTAYREYCRNRKVVPQANWRTTGMTKAWLQKHTQAVKALPLKTLPKHLERSWDTSPKFAMDWTFFASPNKLPESVRCQDVDNDMDWDIY